MGEWGKAKEEAKKEFRQMAKEIKGYSYKDQKEAQRTDTEYRNLIARHLNDSRDFIFPLIEAAYLEKHFDNAGALEEVMKWLDIFLLELGLKIIWSDDATYREYSRLIRLDFALLSQSAKMAGIIKKMKEQVLKGGGGRSVPKKCAQLRQYLSDLMLIFKKRRHALGG